MAEIDFVRLASPFDAADIAWRVQSCGVKEGRVWARIVPYVTCRAIMDRLDAVCGPGNWKNRFERSADGGVLCGIEIRINGEWVGKWDGASGEEAKDGIDAVKASLSSAMKRAGVQWGIGRYLYRMEAAFAQVHEGGRHAGHTKDGTSFRWDPPATVGANGNSKAAANRGVKELSLDEVKRQMDAAERPQALLDWLSENRERIGGCRKAAMEYFNARLRALKEL